MTVYDGAQLVYTIGAVWLVIRASNRLSNERAKGQAGTWRGRDPPDSPRISCGNAAPAASI